LEALQVGKNGVDKEFLPGKYEVVVGSRDEMCGFAADGDRKTLGKKRKKKGIVCSFKRIKLYSLVN
jgi:hypothetical protein